MADGEYPPDDNQGPMLLAASLPFYALALVCFAVRFGSRLHSKFKLTAADWTCAVAVACKSTAIAFMIAAIQNGYGRHTIYITDRVRMVNLNLGVFLAGTGASAFARISIACLLLQFTTSRLWRAIIWMVMTLNILDFLIYEIVQLVSCSTLITLKASSVQGTQCLTPTHVWAFTYAAITVAMVTDLALAIIPIVVIRRLRRSNVEKTVVSILMSSCLLASGCNIAKLYYMVTFDFSAKDGFYLMIPEFFWSRMEEAIIIMAACVPLLKSPVERLFRWLKPPAPGSDGQSDARAPGLAPLRIIHQTKETDLTDSTLGQTLDQELTQPGLDSEKESDPEQGIVVSTKAG